MTFPWLNFLPTKNPKLCVALTSIHIHPPGSQFSISSTNYTISQFFLEIYHYLNFFTPWASSNIHLKPQENAPYLLFDQNVTLSLKIMTLPRIFNFWNVDARKCRKKTDQADRIVQIDHLTGHATDQTVFTFSIELFSHLPDLPLFTFSVEIFFTFTGPVVFHI